MSNLLSFAQFKDFDNWSAKNYLNSNILKSSFDLVALGGLITPRQEKVKKSDYKNDIDLVKKISFKDGVIHLREERKSGMDMYKLHPNDLLVSKINFHQGALATNSLSDILLTSTHYQPYMVNNSIDKKYLTVTLRSRAFQDYLSFVKSEGIKTEATYSFIKTLKIPLPPLETQQKLVESYQAKLSLAKNQEELACQKEAEIETYLYQELGIEQQSEEEQNTDLLQFVSFKDLFGWTVKGFLSHSNFKDSIYQTTKLSKLILKKPMYGSNSKGIKEITNIRYIRITDINEDGTLNNEIVSSEKPESKYILRQNDFLIARSGNTVGKTFLYDKKYGKCIYAGYLIKFTMNEKLINLQYLLRYTKSKIYKEWIASNLRVAGQPNINSQEYLESPVILPPLRIQNKIANHIQGLKDEIQTLKQQAEKNKQLALSEFEAEIFHAP